MSPSSPSRPSNSGVEGSDSPSTSTQATDTPPNVSGQGQGEGEAPGSASASAHPDSSSELLHHHRQQQQPAGANDGQQEQDVKRSRACEACRSLKVRCEPATNEDEPCRRCKKAGRACVVTQPSRKRQKKTDSRVADLEKKIDALTATLQARGAPGGVGLAAGTGHGPQQQQHHHRPAAGRNEPSGHGMTWGDNIARIWEAGSTTTGSGPAPGRSRSRYEDPPSMHSQAPSGHQPAGIEYHSSSLPPLVMAGMKRKGSERRDTLPDDSEYRSPPSGSSTGAVSGTISGNHPSDPSPLARLHEGDIVDRGIITMDLARELFTRYKDRQMPHLPAVYFHPSVTATELRRTKPSLFLAIMAAASAETLSVQRILQKELMLHFAEKVFVTGSKSLELVQALQVAVIWYWPPEQFEELKFYQLVHIAAVTAIDIGLGRKPPPRHTVQPQTWRQHPFRRAVPPDPLAIESRRAWLACYYLAVNTSMSMHRPNLIRWNSFLADSMEVLRTSPDAAPTDTYLCHLVWTHYMGEQTSIQLLMDDPTTEFKLTDTRTQYALKSLERELEKYRSTVPEEMMQPSLKFSFNVINLYMHEVALRWGIGTEQLRPPFNTEALKNSSFAGEPLSTAHINALSACLTAIEGIFETFLSLDIPTIRAMPVFGLVRVAYALVVLIKMYFSATNPASDLGNVIGREQMRVEHYLDALVDKFRLAAADERCRPASKFLVVLAMLRSWFFKQGEAMGNGGAAAAAPKTAELSCHETTGGGGKRKASMTSPTSHSRPQSRSSNQPPHLPPLQQEQQQQPLQEASTPLHLLSEVASGRESGTASGPSKTTFTSITGMRSVPQPFFHNAGSTATTGPQTSTSSPPIQGGPGPVSTATMAAAADMAPTAVGTTTANMDVPQMSNFPLWPPMHSMGQAFDLGVAGFGGSGPDSMDLGADSQFVFNEPWFSDVFQGLPDANNGFYF